MPAFAVAAPQVVGHRRALVDMGVGTPQYKNYFDYGSHTSGGGQRGWANCPCRGCIKYWFVASASREEMCAALYLWAEHGRLDPVHERPAHLAFLPNDADINDALARIRLVDF